MQSGGLQAIMAEMNGRQPQDLSPNYSYNPNQFGTSPYGVSMPVTVNQPGKRPQQAQVVYEVEDPQIVNTYGGTGYYYPDESPPVDGSARDQSGDQNGIIVSIPTTKSTPAGNRLGQTKVLADPAVAQALVTDPALAQAVATEAAQTIEQAQPKPTPVSDTLTQTLNGTATTSSVFTINMPLYFIRNTQDYNFETVVHENVEGAWFSTTMYNGVKESLERWKDLYMFHYKVTEPFQIPTSHKVKVEKCLYSEVPEQPESANVFIPATQFSKLLLDDEFFLDHIMLKETFGINERRFAVLDRGLVLYSADYQIIEQPVPAEGQPGCFFYVTQVLPEDSVLQDWRDKVLNVYFINKRTILPFGADAKQRDEYFSSQYGDYIENEDGSRTLLTSYYDNTVVGKYLKNKPDTAEVFLLRQDLGCITYYSSFQLKLDTVRYVNGVERQMI